MSVFIPSELACYLLLETIVLFLSYCMCVGIGSFSLLICLILHCRHCAF